MNIRKARAANKAAAAAVFVAPTTSFLVIGFAVGRVTTDTPQGALAVAVLIALGAAIASCLASIGGPLLILRIAGARPLRQNEAPEFQQAVVEFGHLLGLSPPALFVVEDLAPNAFSVGLIPSQASIVVTSGLLRRLRGRELQAVVAQRLVLVSDYSMLLGTLLGVLVCPIPLLADGWRGTHSYELLTTRDYLLVSDVMGWLMLIAWMAAALCLRIVRTVWRPEREYAADDVAAHLTGDPLGLADALESIAGASRPLARANRGIAHLFITNPFEGRADGPSLNTYAPISRRTQLLRAMSIEAPDGRRLRRRPSNDHWGVT